MNIPVFVNDFTFFKFFRLSLVSICRAGSPLLVPMGSVGFLITLFLKRN